MPTNLSRPTRERLLDSADALMRHSGLGSATTKAIAREAGCSEAALYKHFPSKEELFVAVLHERLPSVAPLLRQLAADPGRRSVEQCLEALVRQAVMFYEEAFPMLGSLVAAPDLLARYREGMRELGLGPHNLLVAGAAYLERERERGRIGPDADLYAASAALFGSAFQRAFFVFFSGRQVVQPLEQFAPAVARTVRDAVR